MMATIRVVRPLDPRSAALAERLAANADGAEIHAPARRSATTSFAGADLVDCRPGPRRTDQQPAKAPLMVAGEGTGIAFLVARADWPESHIVPLRDRREEETARRFIRLPEGQRR